MEDLFKDVAKNNHITLDQKYDWYDIQNKEYEDLSANMNDTKCKSHLHEYIQENINKIQSQY